MCVSALIETTVLDDINFTMYDSIDKEYVPMGTHSVETDIEFSAHLLIDCNIEEEEAGGKKSFIYEITDAQVVGSPSTIELGCVDYSLVDINYEYE